MADMARRARAEARRYLRSPYHRLTVKGRLLRPWWRWRFAEFGEGAVLGWPRWLRDPEHIAIGAHTVIYPAAWLAVEAAQGDRPDPVLRIGERCVFRHAVVLSATESVVIEDDVGLGANVLVIDADHTWDAGAASVTRNPLVTTPVRIGRGTWVGDGTSVLRGARIGSFCSIGTNSVVTGEIPDFSVAVGAPARVVGSTRDRVPEELRADHPGDGAARRLR